MPSPESAIGTPSTAFFFNVHSLLDEASTRSDRGEVVSIARHSPNPPTIVGRDESPCPIHAGLDLTNVTADTGRTAYPHSCHRRTATGIAESMILQI